MLGRLMGRRTIAKPGANPEIPAAVREIGCDLVQGYYRVGVPLPLATVLADDDGL